MDFREIQTRLKALGYDPGPIDGVPGRLTAAAVREFQSDESLLVDGIVGPKTLAVLFKDGAGGNPTQIIDPPWLALLLSKKGYRETEKRTADFLRSDGRTLGDPKKLPWCGDLVETVMALTLPGEVLPANPYLARNWSKFGTHYLGRGAVVLFWRGSKTGTSGHVGILLGQDGDFYIVGGGNQSDAITDNARIAKSRLLDARWPSTFPKPAKPYLPTIKGGKISTNEA